MIDFTDLKYLPREECQKSDTKISKIAMWGGMNDWELIRTLLKTHKSFKKYLITNQIEYGSGLHPKENESNKMLFEGSRIDYKVIQTSVSCN